MFIRKTAVAGAFYPGEKDVLNKTIDNFLDNVHKADINKAKGFIVPHAGYIYSGQTAAYAYANLRNFDQEKEYTVILIGPAHRAYLDVSVGNYEVYETPLGDVKVNQQIGSELISDNNWSFLPEAHEEEHSIEVQLPFLQKVLKKFSIVSILCGSIEAKEIANALDKYFERDDIIFIISSDLSHFMDYYTANEMDKDSLSSIKKLDLDKIIDACGKTGIKAIMQLCKKYDYRIELLDHRSSGDTAGDKNSVVGYASMAILKN